MDEITEKIQKVLDSETRELSRQDYKTVLEDLFFDIESRLHALEEDE